LDIRRHVVCTADEIKCVHAIVGFSDGVVASLETKLATTNEQIPIHHLSEGAVGSLGNVRVNHTAQWITLKISSMWIEFTS